MRASRQEVKEFFGFDEEGVNNFFSKPSEAVDRDSEDNNNENKLLRVTT